MPGVETIRGGKGTVFVRAHLCKGCAYCVEFCPFHCLELTPGFNARGYHYVVLARAGDCSGCDLCGRYCPDFAIFAVRSGDREKLNPPMAS
jgi:2-oxoglutarate ferredoxin oxidoreductase subunit delta